MANSATKQSKTDAKIHAPQAAETDAEVTSPPPGKRRSLPKLLLLLTLLFAAAGGGAWYMLQDRQPAAALKPGSAKAVSAKPASTKPPVFVNLDPFTVNLQLDGASPQYLQAGLALKVTDADFADAIKLHMPEIRNRVLLLLSGKKAGEISTPEGKKTLSAELSREIVQPLAGRVQAQGLDSVLFTSFVIQ